MDTATQDWRSLESFAFGDSPEMADRLLGFVLQGKAVSQRQALAAQVPPLLG